MKVVFTTEVGLGLFLHADPDVTQENRIEVAIDHLQSPVASVRSRAVCWLTYRSIETKQVLDGFPRLLDEALDFNRYETDSFENKRWRMSLLMASAYVAIFLGRPPLTLIPLTNSEFVEGNPTAAVNVGRAGNMLACWKQSKDPLGVVFSSFRLMARTQNLLGAPPVIGKEIALAAKQVHIATRLWADFLDLEALEIDRSEPFNRALRVISHNAAHAA